MTSGIRSSPKTPDMDYSCGDVMAELSRLERTALLSDQASVEPPFEKTKQWQVLFYYSYEQAVEKIKQRRANLGRIMLDDDSWEEIREAKEAQGFDKDAYEHLLETRPNDFGSHASSPAPLTQGTASATYLFKLEGGCSDPRQVQALIQSTELPKVEVDDDDPERRFCRVSAQQRSVLLARLPFRPTFVRLSLSSKKALDLNSKHPTLGTESTLPQHRLRSISNSIEQPLPCQDQYPVWYFFYGNLGIPSILSQRLGVPEEDIEYHPAIVVGGVMSKWGGKYRALLDGDITSATIVDGSGFLVRSPGVEDVLRMYETDRYEVVRCKMTLKDKGVEIPACTFKFLG